ncbi:hypothetical protein KIN20_020276 [Parelaphostrongylus tenuis]|uniref:Uncharacterized protein n=1 Tax=Parelaphostrongylus tenuis TaxID=148309 RepID=A0AAD5MSN4_PARTN|nr:hypothetical protein KIN20_020276 [Parelaphostrongylus tenuis]
MAKTSIDPFMISLLATISTVLGCGVIPAGQASTTTFTVTGITTLPVAMAYSGKPEVSAQVPGIATTRDGAKAFVSRLVMQTIVNVLESQARSALTPDVAISAILGQLSVRVTYEPLPCQMIVFDVTKNTMMTKDDQFCIIVGDAVTGICTGTMQGVKMNVMCTDTSKATIGPVPSNHTSISGTLMTTNIIMANWSRQMWQSVLKQSGSNVGIWSIWIAFLLGNGQCRWKPKLNSVMFHSNISSQLIFFILAS